MKITSVHIGHDSSNGRKRPFRLTLMLEGAPTKEISVVGRDFEDAMRRLHYIPTIRENVLIREIVSLELQRYAAMLQRAATESFRTLDLDVAV